jgi:hypothetical protein
MTTSHRINRMSCPPAPAVLAETSVIWSLSRLGGLIRQTYDAAGGNVTWTGKAGWPTGSKRTVRGCKGAYRLLGSLAVAEAHGAVAAVIVPETHRTSEVAEVSVGRARARNWRCSTALPGPCGSTAGHILGAFRFGISEGRIVRIDIVTERAALDQWRSWFETKRVAPKR